MSFVHRVAVLVGLLIAQTVGAQWTVTGTPVPSLAAFDTAMHTVMTAHAIPSGQLAVTWQGRLVLARGYSLNPGANDILVQPTSRFRIASVSKQITSTLINRLIQEGRLSLTDTIGNFVSLTPAPGHTADSRLHTITIRNLLEHLAGLGVSSTVGFDPMFYDVQIAAALNKNLPIHQSDIIKYMNGVALASNPGTTFNYSNYGYLLLGRVIESVTGMSYADYAASVFNKIGIWDMVLARCPLSGRAMGEAFYYSSWVRPTVMNTSGASVPFEYGGFNIENMDSHGGWISSTVELVRWLANLDDPAAPNAILNAASTARMFALPQNYPLPYHLGDGYYASGWSVRDYGNGLRNTWHDGSIPGTTSYVVRTQDGWDYAVVLNRRDESGATSYSNDVDNAMWNAYAQITNWPAGDAFPSTLPVIFRGGFDR